MLSFLVSLDHETAPHQSNARRLLQRSDRSAYVTALTVCVEYSSRMSQVAPELQRSPERHRSSLFQEGGGKRKGESYASGGGESALVTHFWSLRDAMVIYLVILE
jgi:hypothetical protein